MPFTLFEISPVDYPTIQTYMVSLLRHKDLLQYDDAKKFSPIAVSGYSAEEITRRVLKRFFRSHVGKESEILIRQHLYFSKSDLSDNSQENLP